MKRTYRDLAHYLKATGTTQKELAARLGCTQGQVSRLANRRKTPGLVFALRISQVARVPVESLVGTDRGGDVGNA